MSGAWTRKGTWALAAFVAFALGALALRLFVRESHAVLANAPAHDVVSRARDSEMEVSPSLAVSTDGTLAVAWIAMMGGRDDGGRYVGARVSAPSTGALGPLMRVAHAKARVSDAAVVPLSPDAHAFVVTWLDAEAGEAGDVYCARLSSTGATPAVRVASGVRGHVRTTSTPDGTVLVFTPGPNGTGVAVWSTRDGQTFTNREVVPPTPSAPAGEQLLGVCGDDRHALVTFIDPKRGVMVSEIPLDPEGPVSTTEVAAPGERIAQEAPTCFVAGQEAFVVYGVSEKPRDDAESALEDSLVFARSKDDARTFWARVTYRPSSRLLHPAIVHGGAGFTMLAVMGGGLSDAHASTSVIVLSADGRSQNGLTRTVIAPVTLVVSPDAAGYMGDTLGLAVVSGVTWAAVVDNASGESHVALVRVL